MVRQAVLTSLILGALPLAALADVVVLKDGERVEGIVTERGELVELRRDFGTITFERGEVKSIERAENPLVAFEARAFKLAERDAEGRYKLGVEAERAGFDAFARELFRQVIAVAPEHRGARAALGYRRQGESWLTEDEYMSQQGYVRLGGGWITREALAAIEHEEAVRREALEEAKRRDADAARIAALEAAVERARVEASERVEASSGVWIPFWTGQVYERRQLSGSAGVSVLLKGSPIAVQGRIGGVTPRLGGGSVAPGPSPVAKSSTTMRKL